jgi:hypothetical protein
MCPPDARLLSFTVSQISPLRTCWHLSLTARASRQVLGEGDDQASAHGGDRIWNVALGPQSGRAAEEGDELASPDVIPHPALPANGARIARDDITPRPTICDLNSPKTKPHMEASSAWICCRCVRQQLTRTGPRTRGHKRNVLSHTTPCKRFRTKGARLSARRRASEIHRASSV